MKIYIKNIGTYLVFIALVMTGTLTLHAEPSVYANVNNERAVHRASTYSSSRRSLSVMKQKIAAQDERIDGLTTIIEGLSASLHKLQIRESHNATVNTDIPNDELLKKLANMIDDINANYVSKEEFYVALGKKQSKVKIKKNKSTASLYSEGVRLFVKKRYADAQKRFTITDAKRYKPAASNYYLGEIAYYTKQYEDAIFYFKKSAGLYDQASYIDTLLLHTAVSLDKSGDKSQAKAFYENIIANYKGKKSAKIAKDRLKKL